MAQDCLARVESTGKSGALCNKVLQTTYTMSNPRIFLSHSSTDKAIVRRVYEELGAALCHYDEATFDPTGSIPQEIHSALNDCSHFVMFASPAAINSPWVQGELSRAFENWMRSGIRRAMVFLLD